MSKAEDDDGVQINLVCCTQVICNEVSRKETRRNDVALTYAMALKSQAQHGDKPDWKAINAAIIARWGIRGLKAVKNRAWGIAEGRIDPTPPWLKTLREQSPKQSL